jgi:sortase B
MKRRTERLAHAAAAARAADRVLSGIIALCLILGFLYCAYALWDNWLIYKGAEVDSDLLKYKPGTAGEDAGLTFSDLQKINPDVCAWLTVDDTNIDYPVVQGTSNMEYINKDVFGEFSMSGSVFLDYRNAKDFSDHYSLIYAHHMEGKVMFGELPEFQEEDFFRTHTSGTLYTMDRSYAIEWFACIYTDAYDANVFQPASYQTEERKEELLSYLKEEAVQYRDLEALTTEDQLLALSTCSDTTTNGRVVLFGRLTETEMEEEQKERKEV